MRSSTFLFTTYRDCRPDGEARRVGAYAMAESEIVGSSVAKDIVAAGCRKNHRYSLAIK